MSYRTPTVLGIAVIMLVIGVAVGSVAFQVTKTETMTQSSIVTTTFTFFNTTSSVVSHTSSISLGSDVVACVAEFYVVWSVESIANSSTIGSTTTRSFNSSYTITTDVAQFTGYTSTITPTFDVTATTTGALSEWTVDVCTFTTS